MTESREQSYTSPGHDTCYPGCAEDPDFLPGGARYWPETDPLSPAFDLGALLDMVYSGESFLRRDLYADIHALYAQTGE
jgi:hypothetical protein